MLDFTAMAFQMIAVEGKLNELLDTEGGISKRKVSSACCHQYFMHFNSCFAISFVLVYDITDFFFLSLVSINFEYLLNPLCKG